MQEWCLWNPPGHFLISSWSGKKHGHCGQFMFCSLLIQIRWVIQADSWEPLVFRNFSMKIDHDTKFINLRVTYCRLKWEKYWYTCTFVYMLKLGYNDLILTLRNRSCHIFWQNCDVTLSRFANLIKQIYYINILLGIVCKYKPTSFITSNIICKNIFYSQMYNLNLLQWAVMLDVMETIVETI